MNSLLYPQRNPSYRGGDSLSESIERLCFDSTIGESLLWWNHIEPTSMRKLYCLAIRQKTACLESVYFDAEMPSFGFPDRSKQLSVRA